MSQRVTWGGRYVVYDELASGGMATVYLAARVRPSSEVPSVVALKRLADEYAKQPEFVAMFLDEAHLAARIRHPNVVTTYEFLRTEEGLGIVMDLVVGASFVQLLRRLPEGQRRAPLPVAAAIMVDALEGLHAAHEAVDERGASLGLVHRDVSPHNIIVGQSGVAQVIDFGIAKAAGRLQITDVGVLKGKFAYMAPEQIRGAEITRATDLYAAGIVLWEACTGKKLFRGSANEELLTKRGNGSASIPPPSSVNPKATTALDAVVLRALALDPLDRYATAHAMAETIRAELEVASREDVASWVASLMGPELERLEARRAAIRDSMGSTVASRTSTPAPVEAPRAFGMTAPLIDIPDGAPQELPDLVLEAPMPKKPPPAKPPPPKRAAFADDLSLDDGRLSLSDSAVHIDLDSMPMAAPAPVANAPTLDVRALPSAPVARGLRPPVAPRRRSFLGFLAMIALGLISVVLVLAALRGPAALRSRVLGWGTARGLTLSVDRVEPTRAGLTLSGVRATVVGGSHLTLVAAQVDVELDPKGDVRRVTLPGYELTLSGSASDVATELRSFRLGKRPPTVVDGNAGHVVWATGEGVSIEALDVALRSQGSTGNPLSLDTASLLVNLPAGHVGPWHARVESEDAETRVRLGFDPSAPDAPPSALYTDRPLDGSSWTLDIPRASTFKIGVPTQIFGLTSDLSLEVALRAHAPPAGTPLTAEGEVGLFGVQIGGAQAPGAAVDIVVAGEVAGDPHGDLPLEGGKLTVGKSAAAVTGRVRIAPDGIRVALDRSAGRAGSTPAFVLDTRRWTSASGDSGDVH